MKTLTAIAVATCAIAQPLAANELKQLPAQLDPSKAYVLVELGHVENSKAPVSLALARYDSTAGDVLGHGHSAAKLDAKQMRAMHEVAANGFARDNRRSLHLLEIDPDAYVIEGTGGTAFSLGSRTFQARAGQVTDLGVIHATAEYDEGGPPKIGAGDIAKMLLFGAMAAPKRRPTPEFVTQRGRVPGDLKVPAQLEWSTRPVVWQAENVTFGNYMGGMVNRMGGRAERPAQTASR